jgi:hypothetical protein
VAGYHLRKTAPRPAACLPEITLKERYKLLLLSPPGAMAVIRRSAGFIDIGVLRS